jgi:hypothetical protein
MNACGAAEALLAALGSGAERAAALNQKFCVPLFCVDTSSAAFGDAMTKAAQAAQLAGADERGIAMVFTGHRHFRH